MAATASIREQLHHHRTPIFGMRAVLADIADGRYGIEDATGRIVEFSLDDAGAQYADMMDIILDYLIDCRYIAEQRTEIATEATGSPVFRLVLTTDSLPLFP
jgi:hypothetical protein